MRGTLATSDTLLNGRTCVPLVSDRLTDNKVDARASKDCSHTFRLEGGG